MAHRRHPRWRVAGRLSPAVPTFFEPFHFHLQPADLLVQLLLVGRGILAAALAAAIGEQLRDSLQQLLLPGRHLAGMDAEFRHQLRRRPVPPDGRLGHFRLQGRFLLISDLPFRSLPKPDSLSYWSVPFSGFTSRIQS